MGSHIHPLWAQRPRWYSLLSPIDVGSHNPPPFGALAHYLVSTPLRGSVSSLAHRPVSGSDTICNSPSPPLVNIVFFGLSLSGFLSKFLKCICYLLGRGFHTLIKNVSFPSLTDVGSYNPPPFGPSILVGTCYSLQSTWDFTTHPPSRPVSSLWHTARCPPLFGLSVLTSIPSSVWL